MKLQDLIAEIEPEFRNDAVELMKTDDFYSLKQFDDGNGYEAFILSGGKFILTNVELDKKQNVLEYECQCADSKYNTCVHLAATLIGIEIMLKAKHFDYHEALQKLAS